MGGNIKFSNIRSSKESCKLRMLLGKGKGNVKRDSTRTPKLGEVIDETKTFDIVLP